MDESLPVLVFREEAEVLTGIVPEVGAGEERERRGDLAEGALVAGGDLVGGDGVAALADAGLDAEGVDRRRHG